MQEFSCRSSIPAEIRQPEVDSDPLQHRASFGTVAWNINQIKVISVASILAWNLAIPRILIVEDNAEVREVVCEFLRDSGHIVLSADAAGMIKRSL